MEFKSYRLLIDPLKSADKSTSLAIYKPTYRSITP